MYSGSISLLHKSRDLAVFATVAPAGHPAKNIASNQYGGTMNEPMAPVSSFLSHSELIMPDFLTL